jgi:ABC-type polysaccharide/polyol phosphate export permease
VGAVWRMIASLAIVLYAFAEACPFVLLYLLFAFFTSFPCAIGFALCTQFLVVAFCDYGCMMQQPVSSDVTMTMYEP